MAEVLKKYRHAWVFSYFIIYLIWFFALEQRQVEHIYLISSPLDAFIPFNEWFVIPYFLWFPYMLFGIGYIFLKDRSEFYHLGAMLAIGLTVCLLTYTVWPNGQALRPSVIPDKNIWTDIVRWLYAFDTSTNVCPSIHVYNAVVIHIALWKSKHLAAKPIIRYGSLILICFISFSTVFLKQHSILDGACALLLAGIMYLLVYRIPWNKLRAK